MSAELLDRSWLVAEVLRDRSDSVVIAGLGNAVFDVAAATTEGPPAFLLDGAMGAAVSMGLGLAIAQPNKAVLVVTGDAELMMNIGALATVALAAAANLSVLCLDNQAFGLTGGQAAHTGGATDVAAMAAGAGITSTLTVSRRDELDAVRQVLSLSTGPSLVVAKVSPDASPKVPVDRDGANARSRFRTAVMTF